MKWVANGETIHLYYNRNKDRIDTDLKQQLRQAVGCEESGRNGISFNA